MNQNITFTKAFTDQYFEQRYILNHLKNFNGGKEADWQDFTKLFLNQFVNYLTSLESISPNTARQYCSNIKALFNIYSDEIQFPTKEYAEILSLRKAGVINICLTVDEIKRIIDYKPQCEIEHTVRNQFLISCFTGMRRSEVILINESNIQSDEVVYFAPKTLKTIYVPCSEIVKKLVMERKTKKLSKVTFNKHIKAICQKVGITDIVAIVKGGKLINGEKYEFITSHAARRTFATRIYEETKDILLVSSLMGHSDIKTTKGYLCCDFREKNKQINYFSQYQVVSG